MRAKAKGEAKQHFMYQILSKGHKAETKLIDEVFSFSDKIREAELTGDASQIAGAKAYKRKLESNARKKLRSWFDEYQKRGIISYEITTNKNGENVYSWVRLMAPTPAERAAATPPPSPGEPAPDEQ